MLLTYLETINSRCYNHFYCVLANDECYMITLQREIVCFVKRIQ